MTSTRPNLEEELNSKLIKEKILTRENFDLELYRALCNNRFIKDNESWSCSWRHAGSIVAKLKLTAQEEKDEQDKDKDKDVDVKEYWLCGDDYCMDYLEYYCSGKEGEISERIKRTIENLGWSIDINYNKENK